jgi:hypothetical protein
MYLHCSKLFILCWPTWCLWMNVSGKRTQVEYTKAMDSPSFWSCLSAFLKFACTKENRVKERKQRIRKWVTIKRSKGLILKLFRNCPLIFSRVADPIMYGSGSWDSESHLIKKLNSNPLWFLYQCSGSGSVIICTDSDPSIHEQTN